jgi:phosphoribosylformylglycinamidine synthase subunit PurL
MTDFPPDAMTPALPKPRPGDPEITPELVAEHGLSPEEYQGVLKILGRTPTFTELGIFSAMWSEHCGYKNSKRPSATPSHQGPLGHSGSGRECRGD